MFSVITEPYVELAAFRAEALGCSDRDLIVIPHPWKILNSEEVAVRSHQIADEILRRLDEGKA